MVKIAIAALVALVVAACSHSDAGSGKQGSGDAGGAGSATGTLVTYTRSGGFAGFNDTLVIGTDRSLKLTDKDGHVKTGTASRGDYSKLDELVHGSAFMALAATYATQGGADRMEYSVLVPGVGKVTTNDGATNPPLLDRVLGVVQHMAEDTR